jgi:hypothetical protein
MEKSRKCRFNRPKHVLMEHNKTITDIFMVPTLKIDRDGMKNNGFLNAYSSDSKKEDNYENACYLLFKPKNLHKFKDFLDSEYDRTTQLIEDYDYEDGYIVVVYLLNREYVSDFNLIKQGKYSKTSSNFKKLFPKVKRIQQGLLSQEVDSIQHRIFEKREDIRKFWEERINADIDPEMEVWGTWVPERETLDIDKIRQNGHSEIPKSN